MGVNVNNNHSRVVKLLESLNLVRILLLIAGVEQNPGPDDVFIFRYLYLLVEIGTAVVRKIFDGKVGSDLVKHLSANNTFNQTLQYLISMKVITTDQAQHLPPIDNSPNSTNMDITLLTCLLRNVCGLRSHDDPVWKNPPPTDFSLEAELARLKKLRNELLHIGTVCIPEAGLTDKLDELSKVLINLNTVSKIPNLSSLIDDAKQMVIDEKLKKEYDQIIKAWKEMDDSYDRGIEELKLILAKIKDDQSQIKDVLFKVMQGQNVMNKSLENVERGKKEQAERQKEQAEQLQEIGNMTKRVEQNSLDCKGSGLDMDEPEDESKIFGEKLAKIPESNGAKNERNPPAAEQDYDSPKAGQGFDHSHFPRNVSKTYHTYNIYYNLQFGSGNIQMNSGINQPSALNPPNPEEQ